jgi:hypothetical protein
MERSMTTDSTSQVRSAHSRKWQLVAFYGLVVVCALLGLWCGYAALAEYLAWPMGYYGYYRTPGDKVLPAPPDAVIQYARIFAVVVMVVSVAFLLLGSILTVWIFSSKRLLVDRLWRVYWAVGLIGFSFFVLFGCWTLWEVVQLMPE